MEELRTPTVTHHTEQQAAELNSSAVRFEQSAVKFIGLMLINYNEKQA